KALGCAQDLLLCWSRLVGDLVGIGAPRFPSSDPTLTVAIDPAIAARPIDLRAGAFPALGWGNTITIAPSEGTFATPQVVRGAGEFTITVRCSSLSAAARDRTLVFEGNVFDARTGAAVCPPIRFVRPADPH